MSDATDSTFSAGETKLLISIIKNLTGDLQVCFRFDTSTLRALLFHICFAVELSRMWAFRLDLLLGCFLFDVFEGRFLLAWSSHIHHHLLPLSFRSHSSPIHVFYLHQGTTPIMPLFLL